MFTTVSNQSFSIQFVTNQNVKVNLKAADRLNLIKHFTTAINQQKKAYESQKSRKVLTIIIRNRRTLRKFFREELKPIPFAVLSGRDGMITHIEDRIKLQNLIRELEKL